jgi:hypothetical protein
MPRITKEILDTYIKDAKSFSEIDIDGVNKLLLTYVGLTVLLVFLK